MNQTQKNIAEYKEKLPHLREKLAAVALLFIMTTCMLVTSTFAWLSLSLNPEVSDVNTSIASNGNLEIALAQGTLSDFSAPGKSKVGDSSLDTLLRNVTWGNLINLNDSRYGLKNLVLRPSLLNDSNLIERPLYGPVYDGSGRVIDMNTNFGYSLWNTSTSRFEASDTLGVRAITSMTYGESGAQNLFNAQLSLAEDANARFRTKYESLANNEAYMNALASMMTGYMVQNILKVNSSVGGMISDATLKVSDLKQFASMYESLISCFEEQAGVYANLLNLQAKINEKDLSITAGQILVMPYDKTNQTAYKALLDKGYTTYNSSDKTIGIIKEMDNFLYDYALIKSDLIRINGLINTIEGQNKSSISWPDCPVVEGTSTRIIDDIINNLTNVGECTITGGEYTNLKIKNVGATAALALKEAGVCETKITNGVLYNMDNRSGARIKNPEDKPLSLTVQVMGTQTIRSNVSTSAKDNYFENERALMAKTIKDKYGTPELIANDSYGFAVDFWVRTNAANSYLTLQGNVLTRTDSIDVKGKDLNGNEVQLYTITVKLENTSEDENTEGEGSALEDMMTTSYDVYESTYTPEGQQEEVDCWRFVDNHQVVTEESLGGQAIPTPLKKVKEVETVIGYEGDNRVWEGSQHSLLTVSSTTQGSGSCYVFYADTPVDQQRSLELLKSMKVAFVDSDGTLLSTAYMDTERHYASAGKVIVPLVLSSESINIGTDANGEITYAITALEQNVPRRITAIVYLDGTNLTNDNVLASADIEGQMNIQFGSSVALIPLNNEKLYNSELYARVESITPSTFNYDTLSDGEKMTSTVKVRVTGTQPQTMMANFIRRINDTQGSPEQTFTLTDADGDGVWEGNYTFLYPGNYILRSVTIDGADRDLKIDEGAAYPTVVVNGFSINSVSYSMNDFVMTDIDSYTGTVTLAFGTNDPDKMPSTVVGKFMRKDGAAVNVNFAYNPTTGKWHGNATFVSSGEYTMQYIVLDNQYVELASTMQKTVDLTLGMKVNVETTSPTTIFYGEDSAPNSLKMHVRILDNNNDPVKNLAGASLTYTMTGTETLYAGLVYNAGAKYYEGEFPVESGTWKFSHVTIKVGESSTNALFKVNSDAPVFTVVPPTPPSYIANGAEFVQYVAGENDSATFTVTLKESGSAQVYAKLVNKDDGDDVVYALGALVASENDNYSYIFNVEESGLWKLESVSVFGVFDENQNYHAIPETIGDENYQNGIVFDSANTSGDFDNREIVVLYQNDVSVSFDFKDASANVSESNKTVALGKDDKGNVTGTFMQQHTLSNNAVKVTITDSKNLIGRGYFEISDVSLSYKYGSLTDASGKSYGGYTSADYENGIKNTSVGALKFVKDSGSRFTLTSDGDNAVVFSHSAQYTPDVLTYKITSSHNTDISNTITSNDASAYKIEVYSNAPSVTVSAVTPTGNYAVDASTNSSFSDTAKSESYTENGTDNCGNATTTTKYNHTWTTHSAHKSSTGSFISGDKLSATVYFKCFHANDATYSGGSATTDKDASNERYHTYYTDSGSGFPTVTLNLQGISGFTSATLKVNNNERIYKNATYTGSGLATNGVWETKEAGSDYVWTSLGNVTRNIGYGKSQKSRWSDNTNAKGSKTPAGTITGEELEVIYGGTTYTFTINKVTINNPY